MALKYFFSCSAVLSISICYTTNIVPVQGRTPEALPCENYPCGAGRECFLKKPSCGNPSCPASLACRPSCDVIRCRSGTYCMNGKCVTSCDQVDCGPGDECVLEEVQCFVAPCPPIPTCKPIDKCALIRCQSGYKCINGSCIHEPTCDGFVCGTREECFLKEVQCIRAPCLPVPACRPLLTCATINCIAGFVCVDRKCIPQPTCEGFSCEPGQECYLERKECITAPCSPPEPVCRPSCALVLCPAPSNCANGQCFPITAESEG